MSERQHITHHSAPLSRIPGSAAFSFAQREDVVLYRRMQPNTNTIERAFELAKSGQCVSVAEIKRRLHAEGYFADQIEGRTLSEQLKAIIDKARKTR